MQSPISPMSSPGPVNNPFLTERDIQQEQPEQRVASIVSYLCGSCGHENQLKAKDAIRCKECGYRIFYKKRTNKKIQFEAR